MAVTCAKVGISLIICCLNGVLYVNGVTISLSGSIITVPVDITTVSAGPALPLICQSELTTWEATDNLGGGEWYLHPEILTTYGGHRIEYKGDRGWHRTRRTVSGHRQVILTRVANTVALEGRLTCKIPNDRNSVESIFVIYPISSVTANIEVVSARDGEFRVQCSSTGGRALSMTVTGPGGYNADLTDDIQPVCAQSRTGSDKYTATSSVIAGGSDGDEYQCTVTSAASNNGSVELRVANAPIIMPLQQTASGKVRVEWSQPTGGAPLLSSIVHTTNSSGSVWDVPVSAESTSAIITGLTDGEAYTISVEAISQHLSGESKQMNITMELFPKRPESVHVVADIVSNSVTVSWGAVKYAERYTVTFTRAIGEHQGLCSLAHHTASLSVNGPTTKASIDVGENVRSSDSHVLMAYSTYYITVVAVNANGNSEASEQEQILTPQRGAATPPTYVQVFVNSSSVLSVQWQTLTRCRSINGRITSYRVQYTVKPHGALQTMVNTHQTSCLDMTLTGLTPFTNYSIEVAAVNEEGDVGVYSKSQSVLTEQDIPGPVGEMISVPSFLTISIFWEKPAIPNGLITHYEVSYWSSAADHSTATVASTSFTTPGSLEPGTAYTFTVRAYTKVGPGNKEILIESTLTRPSAVEELIVEPVSETSVSVSWKPLIIPGIPIETYTVAYGPVSRYDTTYYTEEMTSVFPGSASSAVITGLDPALDYQFQVFATVTEDGKPVEGQRSNITVTTRQMNCSSESTRSQSTPTPVITGVVISLIGITIGVAGILSSVVMIKKSKGSFLGKRDVVNVDPNPAYALTTTQDPQRSRRGSNDDYAIPYVPRSLVLVPAVRD